MISSNPSRMTNMNKRIQKLFDSPANITIQELQIVLEYFGYKLDRIRGSHFVFKNPNGTHKSIPVHNNKIKEYYIRDILKIIYGKY